MRNLVAKSFTSLVPALACALLVFACGSEPEHWVPRTVTHDALLPALEVDVGGHKRELHLETFGDPENPVLLAFHGSEGSDYRAMLPLRELADRYFVVMWDGGGSGLSARIAPEHISIDAYAEEIHQVKETFSPNAPVSYVGYSSGGLQGAIWLSRYPEDLDQLVLIESDAFDHYAQEQAQVPVPLDASWVHRVLFQNEFITPDNHARADYKLLSAALPALQALSCDPNKPSLYPMWRMGAVAYLEWHRLLAEVDLREAVQEQDFDALLIATECGGLNIDFQRQHLAPLFGESTLVRLGDQADHLNLFDHSRKELLTAMRSYLRAYQEAE